MIVIRDSRMADPPFFLPHGKELAPRGTRREKIPAGLVGLKLAKSVKNHENTQIS